MAAADLPAARRRRRPRRRVEDALGGVLCRCTGYLKIVEAVLDVAARGPPAAGRSSTGRRLARRLPSVGARLPRVDGLRQGRRHRPLRRRRRAGRRAVAARRCARRMRARASRSAISTPFVDAHARPRRDPDRRATCPARTPSASFPHLKDQPVLAPGQVRFRGEAVLALVGTRAAVEGVSRRRAADRLDAADAAVRHRRRAARRRARAPCARAGQRADARQSEVRRCRRRPSQALRRPPRAASRRLRRARLYRAGGRLRRAGRRPHRGHRLHPGALHGPRRDGARARRRRRARCASCRRPAAAASAASSTSRCSRCWRSRRWVTRPPGAHRLQPHRIDGLDHQAPSGAHLGQGLGRRRRPAHRLSRCEADFNTGAYASWGPTVANRVPVHAQRALQGAERAGTARRAIYTNDTPAGAFRGFGVPQAAIAHETLMDDLAEQLGIDRWEIRRINALGHGDATPTGQVLDAFRRPAAMPRRAEGRTGTRRWRASPTYNAQRRATRGAASASPACGTASATPRCPIRRPCGSRWRATAGSRSTTARSISARARPPCSCRSPPTRSACRREHFDAGGRRHRPDRRRRQDLGLAPDLRVGQRRAARRRCDLRRKILALANAGADARLALDGAQLTIGDGEALAHDRSRRRLEADADGVVLEGIGQLRPADHAARRQRPGRALRDLRLRRADRRGRGRYRARHGEGAVGSSPRTMSAAPSTRRWSRARSTAASPRGSAWR